MTQESVLHIAKQAIQTLLMTSAPMLITALLIGLLISIFQAATQINEQTMTFVPKIIGVFVVLLIFGPWIMDMLITFTTGLLTQISTVGR